jgi:hypothetical protein
MLRSGFVVAMRGVVTICQYDRPTAGLRTTPQWLIVSRWGADGEFLTVSSAGTIGADEPRPPAALSPHNTLVGLLLSEDEEERETTFLLVRRFPAGITVAGTFFPADGYARVFGPLEQLRMVSEGRHAHSRGVRGGTVVINDVPDPAPDAPGTLSWHIRSERQRWDYEFVGVPRSSPVLANQVAAHAGVPAEIALADHARAMTGATRILHGDFTLASR